VDLEEELKDLSVADHGRVEDDFDGFGVVAVMAVSRIRHIAAGVSNSRPQHTGIAPQQVLHAPEAAAGKNGSFGLRGHDVSFLSGTWG
jgi:hypothetical protein